MVDEKNEKIIPDRNSIQRSFRVRNGKTMSFGIHIFINGVGVVRENTREGIDGVDNLVSRKDYKIMRDTGLVDKNGRKIYEGDILDFDEKERGGKFKNEIMSLNNMIGEWNYCGTKSDITQWRSVIGNIYENPELLSENNF